MSFLSIFDTSVGILLGRTGLLQSNKDMLFSIYVLSAGLTKKETLETLETEETQATLFLRKSEEYLCENQILNCALLAVKEKIMLKITEIAIGQDMVVPSKERNLGISAKMF